MPRFWEDGSKRLDEDELVDLWEEACDGDMETFFVVPIAVIRDFVQLIEESNNVHH